MTSSFTDLCDDVTDCSGKEVSSIRMELIVVCGNFPKNDHWFDFYVFKQSNMYYDNETHTFVKLIDGHSE